MEHQAVEYLKAIFANLDESSLTELVGAARLVTYPPGHLLCHENEREDVFYVIVSGKVEVHKQLQPGTKTFLDHKGAGEFFGEMALILEEPRSADVRTCIETSVLELGREDFMQTTRRFPNLALEMARITIQQTNRHRKMEQSLKSNARAHRIFVCYAREDVDFVTKLVEDLRNNGLNMWLDQTNIDAGKKWDRAIEQALEECLYMLLILSPYSIESENVADEWSYFLEEHKTIIPVLKEPCKLPPRLRRLQHLEVAMLDYPMALARINDKISRVLEK
jgi:CRP-like cAMP-binding protein